MKHYTNLSLDERTKLYSLYQDGHTIRSIARELGRSASTISRELRRNISATGTELYLPDTANLYAIKRRENRGPKISKNKVLKDSDLIFQNDK